MLGGPYLHLSAALAATGSPTTCMEAAGGVLAVGQAAGPTLLVPGAGHGGQATEIGGDAAGATALAFSREGETLLIGARHGALLRLCLGGPPQTLTQIAVEGDAGERIACIARVPGQDVFAVARGRWAGGREGGGMRRRGGPLAGSRAAAACWGSVQSRRVPGRGLPPRV